MFIVTSQRPGFTLSGCTLLSAKRIVAEASTAPSKISFRMTSFSRFWVHSPHLLGPRHGIHLRTTFHRAGQPARAFLCNTQHGKSATVISIPNSICRRGGTPAKTLSRCYVCACKALLWTTPENGFLSLSVHAPAATASFNLFLSARSCFSPLLAS